MSIEKRYTASSLKADDLKKEIDAFWEELKDPNSSARRIIDEEGIEVDPEKLAQLSPEKVITVKGERAALTGVEFLVVLAPFVPLLTPVVKSASNVAEKVILDLWDVAFKRWIKPRRGGDALIETK